MSKPALYYTLNRAYGTWHVMKVTSEKSKAFGKARLYGSIDGFSTHCRGDHVIGQFKTDAAARNALQHIRMAHEKWQQDIVAARATVDALHRNRDADLERIAREHQEQDA